MRKAHTELFSLDVLALALLSCLLASVVGILVLSGEGASLRQRVDLGKNTVALKGSMDETLRSLEAISNKLNQSEIERENKIAQGRVAELNRKIDARKGLADAQAEVVRLKKETEALKQDAAKGRDVENVFGSYHGAYVLVECVRDRVIIYPGRERLGTQPSRGEIAALVGRIQQAGFVLFVVRPSGWFDNSFDKVHGLVSQGLDQAQTSGGKLIGRAILPLEESAPLTQYLPQ